MNGADVLDIARDALWVTLVLAGPILMTALVVGLVISLIQALTQIQEMTLTFVPKILSIFFALLFLFPFMGKVFQGFSERLFDKIVMISANE
ncbi:MAG: flagellar biosynthesis protein FliQ [Alphaproteobacteria bacterium]